VAQQRHAAGVSVTTGGSGIGTISGERAKHATGLLAILESVPPSQPLPTRRCLIEALGISFPELDSALHALARTGQIIRWKGVPQRLGGKERAHIICLPDGRILATAECPPSALARFCRAIEAAGVVRR
jgi:hypothetical protein